MSDNENTDIEKPKELSPQEKAEAQNNLESAFAEKMVLETKYHHNPSLVAQSLELPSQSGNAMLLRESVQKKMALIRRMKAQSLPDLNYVMEKLLEIINDPEGRDNDKLKALGLYTETWRDAVGEKQGNSPGSSGTTNNIQINNNYGDLGDLAEKLYRDKLVTKRVAAEIATGAKPIPTELVNKLNSSREKVKDGEDE